MFRFLRISTFPSGSRWFDVGSQVSAQRVTDELVSADLFTDAAIFQSAGGWVTASEFIVYDGSA